MILQVSQFSIHPDKIEAYLKWTAGAIRRLTTAPGVVEFRAFRCITGPYQVVTTFEFTDLEAWAAWRAHPDVQQVRQELDTFTSSATIELWGPSPTVPTPVRPG